MIHMSSIQSVGASKITVFSVFDLSTTYVTIFDLIRWV